MRNDSGFSQAESSRGGEREQIGHTFHRRSPEIFLVSGMWEQKRKKEAKDDSKVFGITKNGGPVSTKWKEEEREGCQKI